MDPPGSQTRQLLNSYRGAKFIWRAVLIFNLGLGAFLFTRPAKKEKNATTRQPITPAETTTPTPPAQKFEPVFSPIPELVKLPEPLSIEQLFELRLEEKEEGQTSKPRTEENQ
ncbi:hypothetical protein K7X08_020997 [Anisodus acutangulus]|uniref:Uncharacterized protein n=2 Tax=Anisodus TaxID=243963 RepID=A0A9Q1RQS3_9SOLA|nr:hypothetical protein K7X08_020997 [Anisodus acutangulus]KAK4368689.1 hypothetical protein RND71_012481 [Anisodus tanguticus]